MTTMDDIARLRHRRRAWAWAGWGGIAGSIAALTISSALRSGVVSTVLAFIWLVVSALGVVGLSIAAVDTVRLHHRARSVPAVPPAARRSGRHTTSSVILWALEAVRMVLMLCFVAYFLSVQVVAIAYLAGSRGSGSWAPIPIDGVGAAIGDILIGLFWEIIFGLIFVIAGLLVHAKFQERREERARQAA
jgi:hypothetical protein